MLIYYKVDHYEQTSVKLESKYQHVFSCDQAALRMAISVFLSVCL